MQTPKVRFFSSITIKVTIVLMLAFMLVIGLLFYVVTNEGYEKIRDETNKVAIETGKLIVSDISNNLLNITHSAQYVQQTVENFPSERAVLDEMVKGLLADNPEIVSTSILPNSTVSSFAPIEQYKDPSNKPNFVKLSSDYTDSPWYQLFSQHSQQQSLWSHLGHNELSQSRNISYSAPINREGGFWGIVNISVDIHLLEQVLAKVTNELNESYAVLIDNNNQIIATSNEKKLSYLNKNTQKPWILSEYVERNPAWQSISGVINQHNQAIISKTESELSTDILAGLKKFDTSQSTNAMLLNHNAGLSLQNKQLTRSFQDFFIAHHQLENDIYFQKNTEAFVFVIPETNWKLVIVQSADEVNAVAENLSKNLMKYVMFGLIIILAGIFFMLDFLALRPMEETSQKILQADILIDNNLYHNLSEVEFKKITNDEIGIVNGSLKKLLQRIQDNEGKLANINQELEIKVAERTTELQTAMKELKSSQVQLIRSEKMATLGQMVAGVAHEVNTPLTYVQNNLEIIGELTEQYEELVTKSVELKTAMLSSTASEEEVESIIAEMLALSEELEEDEISSELKELIKDSLFGVEQITDMVLNLRNFARLDESKVKKVDLRDCVSSSLKIAHNSIKHHEVIVDVEQHLPEIECSPSQINQVIINLLNNASQAIGNKSNGQIKLKTSANDEHVFIHLQDNGSGMTKEVIDKIFEPFFTTKGAGEGTGLGMAISHQIMEQHNGEIKVESEVGVGTTFVLMFPIKK